jgi:hypothetical protein
MQRMKCEKEDKRIGVPRPHLHSSSNEEWPSSHLRIVLLLPSLRRKLGSFTCSGVIHKVASGRHGAVGGVSSAAVVGAVGAVGGVSSAVLAASGA